MTRSALPAKGNADLLHLDSELPVGRLGVDVFGATRLPLLGEPCE